MIFQQEQGDCLQAKLYLHHLQLVVVKPITSDGQTDHWHTFTIKFNLAMSSQTELTNTIE
jgi:hypothetical protein